MDVDEDSFFRDAARFASQLVKAQASISSQRFHAYINALTPGEDAPIVCDMLRVDVPVTKGASVDVDGGVRVQLGPPAVISVDPTVAATDINLPIVGKGKQKAWEVRKDGFSASNYRWRLPER